MQSLQSQTADLPLKENFASGNCYLFDQGHCNHTITLTSTWLKCQDTRHGTVPAPAVGPVAGEYACRENQSNVVNCAIITSHCEAQVAFDPWLHKNGYRQPYPHQSNETPTSQTPPSMKWNCSSFTPIDSTTGKAAQMCQSSSAASERHCAYIVSGCTRRHPAEFVSYGFP